MLLQISEVGQVEVETSVPLAVEEVLLKYDEVFKEPRGRSPKRSHGHHIVLKEVTSLIFVQP